MALARTPEHETALACVEAGIVAALPDRAIGDTFVGDGWPSRLESAASDSSAFDRVILLAIGKAGGEAASSLLDTIGVEEGLVVTDTDPGHLPTGVESVVGGHPLPDVGSVRAGERALALLGPADERTMVVAAITGGGSALLEAPAKGVSLADLRTTTEQLLDAGTAIHELNAVRKHCSRVKGGRLARAAAPATVAALVVSDVVGDDLATIASGPFAPDPTTYEDALDALQPDAPEAVRAHLRAGARGKREETPTVGDPAFDRVGHTVVANGETAVGAAGETARDRGFATHVFDTGVSGEAREVGERYATLARAIRGGAGPVEPPAVVLAAGEPTVTVRGDGKGGPNTECALAASRSLPDGAVLACIDTDGLDGCTDAAGAVVDAGTWGASAEEALERSDAAGFLHERGALVRTGVTGTNVNDLHVLVVV